MKFIKPLLATLLITLPTIIWANDSVPVEVADTINQTISPSKAIKGSPLVDPKNGIMRTGFIVLGGFVFIFVMFLTFRSKRN